MRKQQRMKEMWLILWASASITHRLTFCTKCNLFPNILICFLNYSILTEVRVELGIDITNSLLFFSIFD